MKIIMYLTSTLLCLGLIQAQFEGEIGWMIYIVGTPFLYASDDNLG